MGGIPTSDPSKFEEVSRVKFELENKINLRSMVDHDLEAEKKVIKEIRIRNLSLITKIKTTARSIS